MDRVTNYNRASRMIQSLPTGILTATDPDDAREQEMFVELASRGWVERALKDGDQEGPLRYVYFLTRAGRAEADKQRAWFASIDKHNIDTFRLAKAIIRECEVHDLSRSVVCTACEIAAQKVRHPRAGEYGAD